MFGVNSLLYKICNWITRFAYVNLLWLSFTAIGLVFLGVFPATVATFTVIRKWVIGKQEEISIFKLFVTIYRKEFLSSNFIGLIIVSISFILYFDFRFIADLDGILVNVASLALTIISLLFAVIVLYIFPVYVHYEANIKQCFKYAIIIGILHPIKTLLMLTSVMINLFITTAFPLLFLLFSISILVYLLMIISNGAFQKVEEKYIKQSKEPLVN